LVACPAEIVAQLHRHPVFDFRSLYVPSNAEN